MKKQKITKVNWAILLFTFVLEIVVLNINLIANLDISIYNEMYNCVKANCICIGLDLIFIFYMLDFIENKKINGNIFKRYKADVNFQIIRSFWIPEIVKLALIYVVLRKTIKSWNNDYISFIIVFSLVILNYYMLYFILPKKENLGRKTKKLRKKNKNLKIILIDGNVIPSSFDILQNIKYKTNKNHLYINIKKDFPEFEDDIKQFILQKTIAIINEIEELDTKNIIKKYTEKVNINKMPMFHIMAVKKISDKDVGNEIKNTNSIKICNINSAIEFTENLFMVNEKDKVSLLRYKKALFNINKMNKGNFKDESQKEEYVQELNIIYQYKFNNKLNERAQNIAKDKTLFDMYQNAYLYQSAYQSVLAMFNYITVMGKIVEYYLYAKNNPKFDLNKIDTDIIGDNPPIWNNQILINICQNEENILYKNIRKTKFKISKEESILLKTYLSYLLNIEIKGDEISFDGLAELFKQFRNKVEAHGIISDANVYAVWNLTQFFVKMYHKIFKISELECEYENDNIKIGYNDEKKVNIGKYIKIINGIMCFVKKENLYINYITGETKTVEKAGNE